MTQRNMFQVKIKERILKSFAYGWSAEIPNLDTIDVYIDSLTDQIKLDIRTVIFGEDYIQTHTVNVKRPSSWWQHLKMDLNKRYGFYFTVKMVKEDIKFRVGFRVLYPDFKAPPGQRYVVVHETESFNHYHGE